MEIITLIINALFGGGILITLATIKQSRKKAKIETNMAEMDLATKYVEEFNKNVKEPLQKDLKKLNNELCKLRKAIKRVQTCKHSIDCPVVNELQNDETLSNNGLSNTEKDNPYTKP
ncbi:MAG: hypothetical protein LBR28_04400 [Bacteroidales bacterium]|jgi:hypothetical protein|nr:hypothetical protein [Bacteroidales bacterium]